MFALESHAATIQEIQAIIVIWFEVNDHSLNYYLLETHMRDAMHDILTELPHFL